MEKDWKKILNRLKDDIRRLKPLHIIALLIFAALFVLWAMHQCEGIKQERKIKREFRYSFENPQRITDNENADSTEESLYEPDRGERPSIEVREQKPEPVDTIKAQENPENTIIPENSENLITPENPPVPETPDIPETPATPETPAPSGENIE